MKKFMLVIILLALALAGCQSGGKSARDKVSFSTPKKAAHYEGNTPAHASTLAATPVNVVIDFNFDLDPGSSISVKRDGKEYGTGKTIIDDNKLSMRRNMKPNAPNGVYGVTYEARWPDGSSHDGSFEFSIDKEQRSGYKKMTGKKKVTIEMADISMKPKDVIIKRGTKVTWVNKDEVTHFVNTDGHPAHTYYPKQNSRGLKKGQSFALVFSKPGIYPYHCSAHAAQMTGSIIVE